MATPLTRLLKKESLAGKFVWNGKSQQAFDQLRQAFTTAPILHHFDETKPVILEADASDLALGAVDSQYGDDGLLHQVAYYSRKFGPAQLNYEIYDKELLAIVASLEHYRHMFEGLGQQITIYSDHHNLLWFTETKIYNRRQAHWAEKLSKYDFVIHFRPGTQGGKPDALSRRPDYVSENSSREPSPILKPRQFAQVNATEIEPGDTLGNADLRRSILDALQKDPVAKAQLDCLVGGFTEEAGLLVKDGLVYVPQDEGIKLRILEGFTMGRQRGTWGKRRRWSLCRGTTFGPE